MLFLDRSQLRDELNSYETRRYRVFNGVKFDLHCRFDGTEDGPFKLVDLALFILAQWYPVDEQEKECKELRGMHSDLDIIEMSREFLIENDCLIFITNLGSTTDWNLITQHLLCESTSGYIVVITSDRRVATHCVDGEQDQVLNVEDLMKVYA